MNKSTSTSTSFSYSSSYSNNNGCSTQSFNAREKHEIDGHNIEFIINDCSIIIISDGAQRGQTGYEVCDNIVKLCNYSVDKGFNSAILAFIYKFFKKNGFSAVHIYINTINDATAKLDFWVSKGFKPISTANDHMILGINLNH